MKYDDLEKLNQLKLSGAITEAEYEQEKAKLLRSDRGSDANRPYWGMDERTFSMFIHLSQLGSFVVPMSGLILPIVMWSMFKEKSEVIDAHGRESINWIISSIIYIVICIPLCFILIGFFLLFALFITGLVSCIIAGVKAGDGKMWRYPLCIRFI